MSLESDLKTYLHGASATNIKALVSTRIEYGPLRQGQTLPAITWHRVNTGFEQAVNRSIKGTLALLQFDAWATTPAGAEAVIAALKTDLVGFTTSTHGMTFGFEGDVPEPEDIPVFHRALQVSILT